MVAAYRTVFGSIDDYRKGGVECLNDDPKRYVYSNMFEFAANSRPHERIAVARNLDYTIEVCRAEGLSPWMVCAHDEFVVAMDYDVTVHYRKLDDESGIDDSKDGFRTLAGEPAGRAMGRIFLKRGHQALLPEKRAYRFEASRPATLLLQSISGPETREKWADICQK